MAIAANQVQNFRQTVKALLEAFENAQGAAQTLDYLGGPAFYRTELEKVDAQNVAIYDITPAQLTQAITALAAVKTLLEADNQTVGKALARMKD